MPEWVRIAELDAWLWHAAQEAHVELLDPQHVIAYVMAMFCSVVRRHPELVNANVDSEFRTVKGAVQRAHPKAWPQAADNIIAMIVPISEPFQPGIVARQSQVSEVEWDVIAVHNCIKLLELGVSRRLYAVDTAHPAPAVPFVWYDSKHRTQVPFDCHHTYIRGKTFGCTRTGFSITPTIDKFDDNKLQVVAFFIALQYYRTGNIPRETSPHPGIIQTFFNRMKAFWDKFNEAGTHVRSQCAIPGSVHLLNHLLDTVSV